MSYRCRRGGEGGCGFTGDTSQAVSRHACKRRAGDVGGMEDAHGAGAQGGEADAALDDPLAGADADMGGDGEGGAEGDGGAAEGAPPPPPPDAPGAGGAEGEGDGAAEDAQPPPPPPDAPGADGAAFSAADVHHFGLDGADLGAAPTPAAEGAGDGEGGEDGEDGWGAEDLDDIDGLERQGLRVDVAEQPHPDDVEVEAAREVEAELADALEDADDDAVAADVRARLAQASSMHDMAVAAAAAARSAVPFDADAVGHADAHVLLVDFHERLDNLAEARKIAVKYRIPLALYAETRTYGSGGLSRADTEAFWRRRKAECATPAEAKAKMSVRTAERALRRIRLLVFGGVTEVVESVTDTNGTTVTATSAHADLMLGVVNMLESRSFPPGTFFALSEGGPAPLSVDAGVAATRRESAAVLEAAKVAADEFRAAPVARGLAAMAAADGRTLRYRSLVMVGANDGTQYTSQGSGKSADAVYVQLANLSKKGETTNATVFPLGVREKLTIGSNTRPEDQSVWLPRAVCAPFARVPRC
jgi:hypothetical protein